MGKHPRVELRDPSQAAKLSRHGRQALLHRLGRAHPRRLVGHQGRGDAQAWSSGKAAAGRRPSRVEGRGQLRRKPTARTRQYAERPASRRRRARRPFGARPWHRARRRLCLAEGRRTGRRCCAIRRCCSPTSAPISRRRTATPRRSSAPTEALQKTLVAEMRGRIKEDDSGVPMPDGPFAYHLEVSPGRPARADRPHAARRRRVSRPSSTAMRWPRRRTTSSSAARRHSPDHRLEAWSADLRGSEYFTIRVRRWQTGEDLPDIVDADQRQRRVGPRFDVLLLRPARREPPAAARSSAIAWARRRATTCWSTRRRTPAGSRVSRKARAAASASSPRGDQETSERWLIDLSRCRRHAAPGGGRARPACATASSIAATSCSSSPTPATRSTSASPRRRSPRRTARTGAS